MPESACLSARIRVADFKPSRTQRRVKRRNGDLLREATSPWATEDQFALFRRYLDIDGDWRDHFCFALTVEEVPQGVLRRWLDGKVPAGAGRVPDADRHLAQAPLRLG